MVIDLNKQNAIRKDLCDTFLKRLANELLSTNDKDHVTITLYPII